MGNTRVDLMYRDGCNYKAYDTVIFTGSLDEALRARLTAALYGDEQLVPEQVGLTHPGGTLGARFPDEEDDHGYTDVIAVAPTDWAADDDRTFEQFVIDCEEAGAKGWDPMVAIDAAGGWTDPEIAARLRGGEEEGDH